MQNYPGCWFGKGLRAPEGVGKEDKCILFVSALLPWPWAAELLPSCDHSACAPGHGWNLGKSTCGS